jgi:hypothetical protein
MDWSKEKSRKLLDFVAVKNWKKFGQCRIFIAIFVHLEKLQHFVLKLNFF